MVFRVDYNLYLHIKIERERDMGIHNFLQSVVYQMFESRDLLSSKVTVVDGNAFFYLSGKFDTDNIDLLTFPESDMWQECDLASQWKLQFETAISLIEATTLRVPVVKSNSTVFVAFDGRPSCMKWRVQKTRMRASGVDTTTRKRARPERKVDPVLLDMLGSEDALDSTVEENKRVGMGMKPWTDKAVHWSRFMREWMNSSERSEKTLKKVYDNVIVEDVAVPGEGDLKMANFVQKCVDDKTLNLLNDGDVVTVITDDSDMLMHMLRVWMVKKIEIQMMIKKHGKHVLEGGPWFVLKMSEFAAACGVDRVATCIRPTSKESREQLKRLKNLLFLVLLFGNDYVPQLRGFQATEDRFKKIVSMASMSKGKMFADKDLCLLTVDALSTHIVPTCKKETPYINDDQRAVMVKTYMRALVWSVANYFHTNVPWWSDDIVALANDIHTGKVSRVTMGDIRRYVQSTDCDDFFSITTFELQAISDDDVFRYDMWYCAYINKDDLEIPRLNTFLNSVTMDPERKTRYWFDNISPEKKCVHFAKYKNQIHYYTINDQRMALLRQFVAEYKREMSLKC